MIPAQIAYGRLAHDQARVDAVQPHVAGATGPLPAVFPTPLTPWKPTLGLNTFLPTCAVVGLANSARRWAIGQGFDLDIPDQKLFDLFGAVAKCNPTPDAIAQTSGLVLLDLLEHVSVNGFDYGGPAPLGLVGVFRINIADLAAVRAAIFEHQSAYLGVTIYQCDAVPGMTEWRGKPAGAVDGGHCLCGFAYGLDLWAEASWGDAIDADSAWLLPRLAEGYVLEWNL